MVVRRIRSLRGGRKRTRSLRGRNKITKKSKKSIKVKSRSKRKSIRKRRRTGGAAAAGPNNAAAPSTPLDIFYRIKDSPEVTYKVLEKIKNNIKFEVDLTNPNENTINERTWLYSVLRPSLIHKIEMVKKHYPEFDKRYSIYLNDYR